MPNELLDILDESGVRFYDGCLIVEVHDHRSTQGSNQNQSADPSSNPTSSAQPVNGQIGPVQTKSQTKPTQESASTDLPDDQVTLHRLVLSPTCETLWKDITLMNEAKIAEVLGGSHHNRGSGFQWGPITPEEAVELEAAILDRTAPALCLSPSIITSRIANQMLNETTLQPSTNQKKARKRPLNSGEEEALRRRLERQEKYMHIADESYDQSFAPTFSRFDLIKRLRAAPPIPPPAQEPPPKSAMPNPQQDLSQGLTPQLTMAPSDLQLPSEVQPDPNSKEAHPAPSSTVSSSQLQPPPSSGLPPTSPPAVPPAPTTAPAPAKKTSKKKATTTAASLLEERSETGSPAPSAPTKKLSKKAQKQLEMTPEAAAAAEEKRKKQAQQRKLQKERRLAAATAKAQQDAQKTPGSALSPPTDKEVSMASATTPVENSIHIPNRDQTVVQVSESPSTQRDTSIPVFGSISVASNDSIPVPNQFDINSNSIPVPNLSVSASHPPTGLSGIPVQDISTNDSIPVPAFAHSIPVHSSNNTSMSDISIPQESLPILQDKDSIPVLSVHEVNSIPVPSLHHQTNDISSIPVPQTTASHHWNGFDNFGIATQQKSSEMDIHVHHDPQVPSLSPNNSIEVPNHQSLNPVNISNQQPSFPYDRQSIQSSQHSGNDSSGWNG